MGTKEKTKPLADHVEVIRDPSRDQPLQDGLDPDVLEYINQFLADFHAMPALEAFDLLSPESARKAVEMLAQRQQDLQSKLTTAKALAKLGRSPFVK